jgi:hypothetical protein
MREFWALLTLGVVGILVGSFGMSAHGQEPREASTEVSSSASDADVVPWVHL